jgi:hypothetical protein
MCKETVKSRNGFPCRRTPARVFSIKSLSLVGNVCGSSAAVNTQALSGIGMNLSKASLITLKQPSHVAQSQLQLDS